MVKKSSNCLVRSDWSIGISRGSCLNHRWMLLDPTAALTPSPSHPNPNFPDPLLSHDPLSPSRPTAATPNPLDPQPPSRRRPPSSPPTPGVDNPSPPLLSNGRGRIRARPFQITSPALSIYITRITRRHGLLRHRIRVPPPCGPRPRTPRRPETMARKGPVP